MNQHPNWRAELYELVQQTLLDVSRTHRCHEKDREMLSARAARIRAANTILLAISSTGILATVLTEEKTAAWVAAITTFVSLLFSLWQLQFAPEADIAAHKDAADKYYNLRGDLRTFSASMGNLDDRKLDSGYRGLVRELNQLTAGSPRTSKKAYRLTKGKE